MTRVVGRKACTSVKKRPEVPSVSIFVAPTAVTVSTSEKYAEMGTKSAVIESGGFSEVDQAGAELEEVITKIARTSGMRTLGPNTSGLINTPEKSAATLSPLGKNSEEVQYRTSPRPVTLRPMV